MQGIGAVSLIYGPIEFPSETGEVTTCYFNADRPHGP